MLTVLVLALAWSSGPAQANPTYPAPAKESQTVRTQDLNRRLDQLNDSPAQVAENLDLEYRIGPQDLLDINIFEAPELNGPRRVSANGEISMPLVGNVDAVGLTARELEAALGKRLLRYMKDPHVSVMVSSVESHPISVIGEVNKPGVFQVREPKSLLEVLSLGQGLAPDAGDDVLVIRRGDAGLSGKEISAGTATVTATAADSAQSPSPGAPSQQEKQVREKTTDVKLKDLLDSGGPQYNLAVYPGDVVEVTKAGIIYVIGSVKKPGGFVLKSTESLSVLQALALAEGLTNTSAKSKARIIRTDEKSGKRSELPINLAKILSGKASDEVLKPADIVFIPDSAAKGVFYRGTEAAVTTASGVAVWRF